MISFDDLQDPAEDGPPGEVIVAQADVPTLLRPTPKEFWLAGEHFLCTEETTWHSDEYVPMSYDVHDEDYGYACGYAPEHDDAPVFVQVLLDLIAAFDGVEPSPEEERVIRQAEVVWRQGTIAKLEAQVAAEQIFLAEATKRLQTLGTGAAHVDQLTQLFTQPSDA